MCEGPIDLFKSQMQIQIIKSKTIPGYVPQFRGVAHAAQVITAHNGVLKGSFQVAQCLHFSVADFVEPVVPL